MKRRIFLYGLLLFIIVGGIPYFTGMLVENQFNQLTDSLADNPNITLQNISYERHWRHSIAKTRVTLEGGLLKKLMQELGEEVNNQKEFRNRPITILLEHDIRHGPFVQLQDGNYKDWEFAQAIVYSKLSLTDEAKAILQKEVGFDDFIVLDSMVSIDGEISINLKGKPIKAKEGDAEHIVWQGIQGAWQINSDLTTIDGQLEMPGFHFDIDGANYQAKNMVFKSESLHKVEEKVWLTKGNLYAEKLIIKQHGVPDMIIDDAKMSARVDVSLKQHNKLQSVMQCKIQTIKVDNNVYGPLTYTFRTDNLTTDAFKALMHIRNAMGVRANNSFLNFSQFQEQISEVLKSRPIFSLENLQLKTRQGPVLGAMQFAIGGPEAQSLGRIDLLLDSIAAKAKMSLPKAFVREILTSYYKTAIQANWQQEEALTAEKLKSEIKVQSDATITEWETKKYVIPTGDNYVITLGFEGGQLSFNNTLMPLPAFR